MAGEEQEIFKDVDRIHFHGEGAATTLFPRNAAALPTLGCDDRVRHAHRAVAVEGEGPEARQMMATLLRAMMATGTLLRASA